MKWAKTHNGNLRTTASIKILFSKCENLEGKEERGKEKIKPKKQNLRIFYSSPNEDRQGEASVQREKQMDKDWTRYWSGPQTTLSPTRINGALNANDR